MEKNNILFVVRKYIPSSDPAGLVLHRYVKLFIRNGYEITIITEDLGHQDTIPDWLEDSHDVNLVRIKKKKGGLGTFNYYFNVLIAAYKFFVKNKKSYVLTQVMHPYTHFIGIVLKLFTGGRVYWLASFTDPYAKSPFKGHVNFFEKLVRVIEEKLTFKLCDKLIFVSESMQKFIINDTRYKFKSIVIPFFYLDDWKIKITEKYCSKYHNDGIHNSIFTMIHAGRIYGNRDASNLFKAISSFPNSIVFEQYGEVSNLHGLHSNLAKNIHINEPISYEMMLYKINKSACVIILDSFFDSMKNPYIPSKIVDAMYLNKPIIGITEKNSELDIFLKRTGNISVSNEVNAICHALRKFIADPVIKTNYEEFSESSVLTMLAKKAAVMK